MVEVLVSAILLVVMAMATFSLLDHAGEASGHNRSRAVASNLAHADLDRIRQMAVDAAGAVPRATTTKTVDNITYQVTSTAEWTADEGTILTCSTVDGGRSAQYLRISSSVSWPGMGSVKPVVAESIITPRAREVDPTLGSLAFKLQDSAGEPLPGATVTANGQSLLTDEAGCVIFGRLPAGTVPVTFAKPGYIDRQGRSPGTYDAPIAAGQTAVKTASLGMPVKIKPVTFKDESGASAQWVSYTAVSGTDFLGSFTTSGLKPSILSDTWLYPFSAGYRVYAGTCAGNDPTLYDAGFSGRGAPFAESAVVPEPNTVVPASAFLRRVSFTARGNSSPVTVVFKPATSVSQMNRPTGEHACDETLTLSVPSGGTVDRALPYGVWAVCVSDDRQYRYRSQAINAYYNTPAGDSAPTTTTYGEMYARATAKSVPTAAADVQGGSGSCTSSAW